MGSRIGALQIGCGWMVSGQDDRRLASIGINEDEVEDSSPRGEEEWAREWSQRRAKEQMKPLIMQWCQSGVLRTEAKNRWTALVLLFGYKLSVMEPLGSKTYRRSSLACAATKVRWLGSVRFLCSPMRTRRLAFQ